MRGKMWFAVLLVLASALLVAVTGCGRTKAVGGEPARDLTLEEGDSGRTVTLPKGGVVRVRLQTTPGTGFSWVESGRDDGVLERTGDEVAQESGAPKTVGGSVSETLTYKAVAAGRTQVKLEYRRVWEKDVPAEKTFEIAVSVE